MRTWQKRVLWIVSGLAFALMIAAFAVHVLTASAHLKEIARDKVQQAWSRELTVGDLALDLFPYPRLHATDVTVSNPGWAQDKHLLEAANVTARLALIPLLTGKIVVKNLGFDGLKINLEIAKDGTRSWDLPPARIHVDLSALSLQNGTIGFRDRGAAPVVWQVKNAQFRGDNELRNVSFDIRMTRDNHLLLLDGTLKDLSAFGVRGATTEGTINAKAGQASATITGKIPLDLTLQNYDIAATIEAASMQEAFGFLGIARRTPAALKASVAMRASNKKVEVSNLKLQLGKLNLSGEGQLDRSGAKPIFNARLQADRIDMIQTFLDAGQPRLPAKAAGELFRDEPLAWPLLVGLDGTTGKVEASIASLKLRSGIEVTNAAAKFTFNDDRMAVTAFSGKLLGGTAAGDALLEGRKKGVRLNLQLTGTSLAQWFKETGKTTALMGGPMKVDARVSTSGTSMKDLAAGISGPVNIQIGPTKILSPAAGNAEFWLTGLFSAKDSKQVNLACASARLPFQSGVAQGVGIVGARSDASQLLTNGTVDLHEQTVDLRGRVRARSGISLGVSTFAGEVKIGGKIAKPHLNMDSAGVMGALARIGAAIVTSGASVVATSIWDGANPESDPCQVVFSPKVKAAHGPPKASASAKRMAD